MRASLLISLFFSLFQVLQDAQAEWHSLNLGHPTPAAGQLAMPGDLLITGEIFGFYAEPRDGFLQLSLEEPYQSTSGNVGEPEIPACKVLLLCPTGSFQVQLVEEEVTSLFLDTPVHPVPPDTPLEDPLPPVESYIDSPAYATNTFFPQPDTRVSEPAIFAGNRFVAVTWHPLKYNPVTGELRITTRYHLQLTPVPNDTNPLLQATPQTVFKKRTAKKLFLNYANAETRDPTPFGKTLIITPEWALPALDSLTLVLRQLGYNPFHEIMDHPTQEEVLAAIQYRYDTDSLDQVILVSEEIPLYRTTTWNPHDSTLVEHYYDTDYAFLEGSDQVPDIAVGRISTENSYTPLEPLEQLAVQVRRFIRYQTTLPAQWDPRRVLLLAHQEVGYDTSGVGRFRRAARTVQYTIETYGTASCDTLYGIYPEVCNQDLTDIVNSGTGLAVLFSHSGSNWFCWHWTNENGEPVSYDIEQILGLNNGRKTPLIADIACNTSPVQNSSICAAEAALFNANGGFTGHFGATETTCGITSVFSRAIAAGLWHPSGPRFDLWCEFELFFRIRYSVHREFHWLGIPVTSIRRQLPAEPDVELLSDNCHIVGIRVLDPFAYPIAEANVVVMRGDTIEAIMQTDDEGGANLENLSNGVYKLFVSHPQWLMAERDLILHDPRPENIQLTYENGGFLLTWTPIDPDCFCGQPVAYRVFHSSSPYFDHQLLEPTCTFDHSAFFPLGSFPEKQFFQVLAYSEVPCDD